MNIIDIYLSNNTIKLSFMGFYRTHLEANKHENIYCDCQEHPNK